MADYTQPNVVNKRVRFFDGQFLQDQDFIDEQRYHLDRQRRLSRVLAVQGIASGLAVTTAEPNEVTVSPGTAVDALGRMLVLDTPLTVRLPSDRFAEQQGIELQIVYQQTATDLAQTGGKSERRWDERPKIVAAAPDGALAVAPDGAPTDVDGPTVLLAQLALADDGTVTADTTVARRSGLSVPGVVRVGSATPQPGSDLEIGDFDNQSRYLSLKAGGGEKHQSGIRLWAGREDLGCSVAYDERRDHGQGLHVRTHDGAAEGASRLFVDFHSGKVGVNTVSTDDWRLGHQLTVSAQNRHLQLRRERAETTGGTELFLELFQDDSKPPGIPEVFPSIRFHHHHRFWRRIEGRPDGFHFMHGDLTNDSHTGVTAGSLRAKTAEIGDFDDKSGYLTVKGQGGKEYLSGVKLWTWRDNHGCSVAFDTRQEPGRGLHIRTHHQKAEGDSRLFVDFDSGKVGINTHSTPARNLEYQLTVSAANQHLQLCRERTQGGAGSQVFLELFQDDSRPPRKSPVFPSIRFHHSNRFWKRVEGRPDGFHFMHGDLTDSYTGIQASSLRLGSVRIGEIELGILKALADTLLMTPGPEVREIQAAWPGTAGKIMLQAHNDRFVRLQQYSDGFRADGFGAGGSLSTPFGLVRLFGNYVALKVLGSVGHLGVPINSFLRVGDGDRLVAGREQIGLPEIFCLEEIGKDRVALRARTGKYVCAEGAAADLVVNRDQAGAWETFRLHTISD